MALPQCLSRANAPRPLSADHPKPIHPRQSGFRSPAPSPNSCSAQAGHLGRPDWPPGSVIYTGTGEPNRRVVRELDTRNDDPEMHFTVLVVDEEPPSGHV